MSSVHSLLVLTFHNKTFKILLILAASVADPGSLYRIPDPGSKKIPDPHQRVEVLFILTLYALENMHRNWIRNTVCALCSPIMYRIRRCI
jgi:hypothetical protein